ncbi:hypothetical protein DFH06DRAFT_1136706 [Mycena polygramma]|nr:hypothetical protein DFH06DRAFT_1136706 [Mycena polygramma]
MASCLSVCPCCMSVLAACCLLGITHICYLTRRTQRSINALVSPNELRRMGFRMCAQKCLHSGVEVDVSATFGTSLRGPLHAHQPPRIGFWVCMPDDVGTAASVEPGPFLIGDYGQLNPAVSSTLMDPDMYTSRPALITGCLHLWASAWRRRAGCTYPIRHFTKRDLGMYMSRPALIFRCPRPWASARRRRVGCTYPIRHFPKSMYVSRPASRFGCLRPRASAWRRRVGYTYPIWHFTKRSECTLAAPRQILDARPRWRWHGGVEAGAPTQFGTSLKGTLECTLAAPHQILDARVRWCCYGGVESGVHPPIQWHGQMSRRHSQRAGCTVSSLSYLLPSNKDTSQIPWSRASSLQERN